MTTHRLFVRIALMLLLIAVPFAVAAYEVQGAAQAQAPASDAPRPAARPVLTWADQVLQQQSYDTPPPELASAGGGGGR